MPSLALKDFDILSDDEKTEAVALLNKYEQLEKQDDCQHDCGRNLSRVVIIKLLARSSTE